MPSILDFNLEAVLFFCLILSEWTLHLFKQSHLATLLTFIDVQKKCIYYFKNDSY